MKGLISQLRMLIAEWLLGWVFDIAPSNGEGKELKLLIGKYVSKKVLK